jgi:hypothetical protein
MLNLNGAAHRTLIDKLEATESFARSNAAATNRRFIDDFDELKSVRG